MTTFILWRFLFTDIEFPATCQVQYEDAELRDPSEALVAAADGQLAEEPPRHPDEDYPLDPVQHDRAPEVCGSHWKEHIFHGGGLF